MNREELQALYEKDEFLFKLYFTGLRRYMDYSSGIVGIKRKISLSGLQEEMYVAPHKGEKTMGLPHKSKIRRALSQLQKYGLIKCIRNKKYLIFELPLATRDKSVQNKADTKPTHLADAEADTLKISISPINTALQFQESSKADTEADTPKIGKADTPPLSVTRIKEKELLRSSKKKSDRRSKLMDDFQVTEQHVFLAIKNDWPDPHGEIDAFKDYHLSKGTIMLDWDRAFYTWLRNAKRFRGVSNATNQAVKQNSMQRAIDNLLNSPSRAR